MFLNHYSDIKHTGISKFLIKNQKHVQDTFETESRFISLHT